MLQICKGGSCHLFQWVLFSVSQQPQSENSEVQATKVNVTPARAEPQQKQDGFAARKSNPQPCFNLQPLSLQAQALLFGGQVVCFGVVSVLFCVAAPLEGYLLQVQGPIVQQQ